MTRRRYVYRNGVAHEVGLDYAPEPARVADSALWNDRLYQDDGDKRYNSRSQHRAYMERNGLSTMDDYTDTWAKAEKARKAELAGIDPSRKKDLISAFQRLREKNHHG